MLEKLFARVLAFLNGDPGSILDQNMSVSGPLIYNGDNLSQVSQKNLRGNMMQITQSRKDKYEKLCCWADLECGEDSFPVSVHHLESPSCAYVHLLPHLTCDEIKSLVSSISSPSPSLLRWYTKSLVLTWSISSPSQPHLGWYQAVSPNLISLPSSPGIKSHLLPLLSWDDTRLLVLT